MDELVEVMLDDIDRIKAENKELKKMLKLAVEDLEKCMLSLCRVTPYQPKREPCNECLYLFCCKNPGAGDYVKRPHWAGIKVAKKLIGDDKND